MNSPLYSTLCPVCGFDLGFKPWVEDSASDEYCPSCGIQFGFHDVTEASGLIGTKEEIYIQWREKWISDGMKWDSPGIRTPKNWDPKLQLKQIGVDLSKKNQ